MGRGPERRVPEGQGRSQGSPGPWTMEMSRPASPALEETDLLNGLHTRSRKPERPALPGGWRTDSLPPYWARRHSLQVLGAGPVSLPIRPGAPRPRLGWQNPHSSACLPLPVGQVRLEGTL